MSLRPGLCLRRAALPPPTWRQGYLRPRPPLTLLALLALLERRYQAEIDAKKWAPLLKPDGGALDLDVTGWHQYVPPASETSTKERAKKRRSLGRWCTARSHPNLSLITLYNQARVWRRGYGGEFVRWIAPRKTPSARPYHRRAAASNVLTLPSPPRRYDSGSKCGKAVASCVVDATPAQVFGYFTDRRSSGGRGGAEVIDSTVTTSLEFLPIKIGVMGISDRESLYRTAKVRNDRTDVYTNVAYSVEDPKKPEVAGKVRVDALAVFVVKPLPGSEGKRSECWR